MTRNLRTSCCRLALLALLGVPGPAQHARKPAQVEIQSNPDARTRAEAAKRLAKGGFPQAVELLRNVLRTEQAPLVVDAIVSALAALGAPVSDPAQCGELIGRCLDPKLAAVLFDCWRDARTPEEIYQAAISGPPVLRARAALALVQGSGQPLMDEGRRQRVQASLSDALSGKGVAPGTAAILHQAVWEISGKNMAVAIRIADRIGSPEGRLAASVYLSQVDLNAYLAGRRLKQFLVGLAIAAAFAVLTIRPRLRRAGILLAASAACWALWAWVGRDARQLPPLGLSLLTTSFFGFLSAGLAAALAVWLPWEKVSTGFVRILGKVGVVGSCAGILAALATLWTRNAGLFPILDQGWDTIVEPMAALNLGIMAGAILAIVDTLVYREKTAPKEPEPDPLAGLE
jgi:hypothetical protein